MNPEERDQFAEKLLNATLGRYSAAEPAPGLEERLLAKLATAPPKPKPVAHRWVWVAAAAVVLLAAVAVMTLWHRPVREVAKGASAQAAPATQTNPSNAVVTILQSPTMKELSAPSARKHLAVAMHAAAPHLEQFPTPAPPSEQERFLLSYVDRTPVPELLATNARLAAERDADLKRFFADADPANPAGDAQ
jgi:hypothetical protein